MSKQHLSKPSDSSADSISYASKIQPITKPLIEPLIKPYSLKRFEEVYGINQPLKEEKKTISASVGKDGQNDQEDVVLVQNKLVALGLLSEEDCAQEQPEISETEEIKKPVLTKTIEAINTLQKYLFKGESYGIVKPNMQTMQALRIMNRDDLARLKVRYEEHVEAGKKKKVEVNPQLQISLDKAKFINSKYAIKEDHTFKQMPSPLKENAEKYLENDHQGNHSSFTTSEETIRSIFPQSKIGVVKAVVKVLNKYMSSYGVTDNRILALFLSQVGHESGGFQKYSVTEGMYHKDANHLKNTYPFHFNSETGKDSEDYLRDSKKLANYVYSNRMGNSNENSGDGWKYRGRGLMQLTGKSNYEQFTLNYNSEYKQQEDFAENPDYIADKVELAVLSALWYFKSRVISKKSFTYNKKVHSFDIHTAKVFDVTLLVNGGLNGLQDRIAIFNKARKVLMF